MAENGGPFAASWCIVTTTGRNYISVLSVNAKGTIEFLTNVSASLAFEGDTLTSVPGAWGMKSVHSWWYHSVTAKGLKSPLYQSASVCHFAAVTKFLMSLKWQQQWRHGSQKDSITSSSESVFEPRAPPVLVTLTTTLHCLSMMILHNYNITKPTTLRLWSGLWINSLFLAVVALLGFALAT